MGIKNYIPILVLGLAIWSGCKSQDVIAFLPISDDPFTDVDTAVVKDLPKDTVIGEAPVYRTKDRYTISMLLPLHLDSVFTASQKKSRKIYGDYVFPPSVMALDFFRGASIALNELEERGFKANINVYDTKKDSATVLQLIESGKLDNSDIIIGPIYNSQFVQVLNYANKVETPIVSPLSPSINISDTSFNYIQMNPALNVHCRKIFEYLMANYKSTDIVLSYRLNGLEIGMAQLFDKWLEEYNVEQKLIMERKKKSTWLTNNENDSLKTEVDTSYYNSDETLATIDDSASIFKKYVFIEDEHELFEKGDEDEEELIDRLGITEYFAEFDTNIVVVLSVDYKFVNIINKALSELTENYLINVYGLPIWGDFDHFRLDYIQKLNVHFTSASYIDSSFYIDNDFYLTYIDTFGTEPSEIAIKGYDIMNYIGTELYSYGSDFSYYILGDTVPGISTSYVVKPNAAYHYSTNKAFVPVFLQNNYVHLLKYNGYSIEKVK